MEVNKYLNPIELSKTVYLGDRAIKAFYIDAWKRIVKIQVDSISRVRGENANWNFYTEEDIEDGWLVFTDTYSFEISPAGAIPHDYIGLFNVSEFNNEEFMGYKVELSSADLEGKIKGETCITLLMKDFYLENPQYPGKQIRE